MIYAWAYRAVALAAGVAGLVALRPALIFASSFPSVQLQLNRIVNQQWE